MSILNNSLLLGADAGAAGYQISRSLRFNSSDSAFLSRTPASAGNRRTFTFSFWMKRSADTSGRMLGLTDATSVERFEFLHSSGSLYLYAQPEDKAVYSSNSFVTNAVLRDFSAWYHVVLSIDTTQATNTERLRCYLNGSRLTFSSATYPTLNNQFYVNAVKEHLIGGVSGAYFSGYLADIHFIDGQALTPSSFAETNATTGQWVPKAYTGSYGTNGFRLDFSDNSAATATTLGKDRAGSNNWTPNNLSVQRGNGSYVGAVTGTPYNSSYTISNMFDGNTGTSYLSGSGTTTWTPASPISFTKFRGNIYQDSGGIDITFNWSGGSYVFTATSTSAPGSWINFTANLGGPITSISWPSGSTAGPYVYAWEVNDQILVDYRFGAGNDSLVDTPTSYGTNTGVGGEVRGNYCTWNPIRNVIYPATTANGNLELSVASGYLTGAGSISVSTGKWYWEMTLLQRDTATPNYQWAGVVRSDDYSAAAERIFTGASSAGVQYWGDTGKLNNTETYGATFTTNDVIGVAFDVGAGSITFYKNGVSQGASTFNLVAGAGYYPSAGGGGNFKWAANFGQRPFAYTAPSGFKALCDTNLPAPVVAKPSTVMDVKLYTGNGSTQTISGLGFSPDFVWIKGRGAAVAHQLFDQVRGVTRPLDSSYTYAENGPSSYGLTAFNSDGFSLNDIASGGYAVNGSPGGTYSGASAAYVAWAWDAGSSTVTNTSGSISSQVRANASAGFSIVTYTGTGAAATIGHGLNVAPSLILCKSRSLSADWLAYHSSLGGTQYIWLNLTNAAVTDNAAWNNTNPTSTVFSVRTGTGVNSSGATYVAYCFAPVAGYSAFGSYTGNGSADGPFVYTGFRPRWILIKRTDSSGNNWVLHDTARDTYNAATKQLLPSTADAETDTSVTSRDILSNGFKLRGDNAAVNGSSATYIYAAFAENPFQYARAR